MSKPFRPIDGRICKCGKRINRYSRSNECAACARETCVKKLEKTGWKAYRRTKA